MRNQATHQELTTRVRTTAAETRVGIAIAVEPLLANEFTQLKEGQPAASFGRKLLGRLRLLYGC